MVNAGTFRDDLYFRIAQARVRLPGLVDRTEDIRPLIQHFLASLPPDVRAARSISPEALESVAGRRFSGNVRELKNVVERLAMLADGPVITMVDVSHDRALSTGARLPPPAEGGGPRLDDPLEPFKDAKRTVVDRFEREYLTRVLARAGTNVSRAAALAGVERQTLRDLLKKHRMRGDE
jgi:DNA-binding NtrC family response regulator